MEINRILTADILDIIFDGRNKSYGAYELRKTYKTRFFEALLIACAIVLGGFFIPDLLALRKTTEKTQLLVKDLSLENFNKQEEKKAIEPPPPPPPKQQVVKVEISKFTPPVIVKDEEVKKEDEIKDVSKLEDTKIGTINQEGEKDQGLVAPPVETKTTVAVAPPPKQEEDYEKIFTSVEIPAEFPGGQTAWQKYLERNLNRELAIENGAPFGKYMVTVTFIVDKEGNISDVRAENDPGYGTKDEAIRVIKKGPNWIPAMQNGRHVTYRHRQNIVFIVAEADQ